MADFERLQSEVIACVSAAEGLPIDNVKLASPFDARVRYNLYAALTLVPRHQHRHLLQAERAAGVAGAGSVSPRRVGQAAKPQRGSPRHRPSTNPQPRDKEQHGEDRHAAGPRGSKRACSAFMKKAKNV